MGRPSYRTAIQHSQWSEYVRKVVLIPDESYMVTLFQTGQLGLLKVKIFIDWDHDWWAPFYSCDYDDVDARIDDIVNYKGKILGVDRVGRVYDVGYSRLETRVIVPAIAGSGTKRKRLVESNGLLCLVVRGSVGGESNGGVRFKVFELNEDLDEWVEVGSIGGMVFLFGLDFSFSVSPEELDGFFRKDCIVYNESSFRDYDGGVDDDVMLFSDLKYGDLRIGVWHMEDPCHCGIIGSYPGCSNVLWPPPTWLWSIDMPKRIEDLEAALDDLLINAPAEKLKAMSKELPPLEQAIVMDDDASQQDVSEIWRVAHTMKLYLNEAKVILKYLESIKTNFVSRKQPCKSTNIQDQVISLSSHAFEN